MNFLSCHDDAEGEVINTFGKLAMLAQKSSRKCLLPVNTVFNDTEIAFAATQKPFVGAFWLFIAFRKNFKL